MAADATGAEAAIVSDCLKNFKMAFSVEGINQELAHNLSGQVKSFCETFKHLFEIKEIDFKIKIHNSREEFEKALGRKTMKWEVGNGYDKIINLISKDKFSIETSHNEEEFYLILKHEIGHIFYFSRFKTHMPIWLNEGICSFYGTPKSGSILKKNKAILQNFSFDKMHFPADFRKFDSTLRYEIVCSIIKKIIKDCGEEGLRKFIKAIENPSSIKEIKQKFMLVFSKSPEKFVEEWLNEI